MATILLTGCAGFIGFYVTRELLKRGDTVIGIDDMNDYYDVKLKEARLEQLKHDNFKHYKISITDYKGLEEVFKEHKVDKICNLAAQAGVRYSLENPFAYHETNGTGLLNLFELAKNYKVPTVVYASSSSVYGGNTKVPFSESDNVDKPVSLYAATKKYNELMAHVYHHLYGIKCTGLRFFTVYGPWGRPDMALFKFVKNILADKPIDVYNYGNMKRDFTFITDIAKGVIASLDKEYDYEIFNIGNNNTVELNYFIEVIEDCLGKKAIKNMMEMQPGDVPATFADISKIKEKLGFVPQTKIEEGIKAFVDWYLEFYESD